MSRAAGVSLLVGPAGSPAASVLGEGLRAAGLRVVPVPTVYDAVAEAQAAAGHVRYIIVCVDGFGRSAFGLFPLVRREWPDVQIVAWHSPGFEYKGRLAELVGADLVLGSLDAIASFLDVVAPAEVALQPSPPTAPPPPAGPAPVPPAVQEYLARAARAEAAPAEHTARPEIPPPAPAEEAPAVAEMAAGAPPQAAVAREAPAEIPPQAAPAWEAPAVREAAAGAPPQAASALPADLAAAIAEEPVPVDEARPAAGAQAAGDSASFRPAPSPDAAAGPAPRLPPEEIADEVVDGNVIATIELTEEELRLLLGEEDEA